MRFALAALLLALAPTAARAAQPPEVARALPEAERVGAARFQALGFSLFDAALYADGDFSWSEPFALTLTYRRAIKERAILRSSISEMAKRTGAAPDSLAPLRARLEGCFADVAAGDRITGVSTGPDAATFYYNGARRCDVAWPGFRRTFFGIWLAAEGGKAQLYAQLRGE